MFSKKKRGGGGGLLLFVVCAVLFVWISGSADNKCEVALACMGIERQRAWATMDKARLVLGDYGHKTPAGLGSHWQNPLGFGLPSAKFTCVWALMGKTPRVWATMGKIRLVLGYHGQSLLWFGQLWAQITRGFGLPWAKSARFWATMGNVYLGLGDYGQSSSGFGLPRPKLIWVWATTGTAVYNGRPL